MSCGRALLRPCCTSHLASILSWKEVWELSPRSGETYAFIDALQTTSRAAHSGFVGGVLCLTDSTCMLVTEVSGGK
jgi:hypothetical protein